MLFKTNFDPTIFFSLKSKYVNCEIEIEYLIQRDICEFLKSTHLDLGEEKFIYVFSDD